MLMRNTKKNARTTVVHVLVCKIKCLLTYNFHFLSRQQNRRLFTCTCDFHSELGRDRSCIGQRDKNRINNHLCKRPFDSILTLNINQRSLRDSAILHGVCVGKMIKLKAIYTLTHVQSRRLLLARTHPKSSRLFYGI